MNHTFLIKTNAVLESEYKPDNPILNFEFKFQDEIIIWKQEKDWFGKFVNLVVKNNKDNYENIYTKILKFISLINFSYPHIEKLILCPGERISSTGNVIANPCSHVSIIQHEYIHCREKFSRKFWSMISFALEAKNSDSEYYKFMCYYRIIQNDHLHFETRDKRKILVEDQPGLKSFINSTIPTIIEKEKLTTLTQKIAKSKLDSKTIADYIDSLFRDSLSHAGFLCKNNYKHGYPTINPSNSSDRLKFQQMLPIIKELAYYKLKKVN